MKVFSTVFWEKETGIEEIEIKPTSIEGLWEHIEPGGTSYLLNENDWASTVEGAKNQINQKIDRQIEGMRNRMNNKIEELNKFRK